MDVVPGITVGEFAKLVGVNPTDIVRVLFGMGQMITVTQSMSEELIELVALELEADVRMVTPEELEFGADADDDPASLRPRPPVVTVMGHVDHGKTLLLDAIRKTDVVSGEAGGITQHIGAYQVVKDGRKITFIDTPGHEAFTAMRARGAEVTDVAILVVAADDGVKPQTVEAIDHIRAAEVPIIVAVNKIDKEGADPTRVRTQLTEYDLVAEEFGGQTTMVNVSAKAGTNLDDLLELVLLQADVAELTANPDRKARGAVIEANLDRGRGAVATVLVQAGTLRIGDNLVAGVADCRIRAMFDADGRPVKVAGPSDPVEVLGWSEVPAAGDEFRVVEDERTARDIAASRQARMRRAELANRRPITLDQLSGAIAEGKLQTLNLIIKGDVSGSVEAVADAMNKLELPEVKIRIVRKGVGAVTEDDVSLAQASEAIIIAFNVRPGVARAAGDRGVRGRPAAVLDHLQGGRGHRGGGPGHARPDLRGGHHRPGHRARDLPGPARRVRLRVLRHRGRAAPRQAAARHPRRRGGGDRHDRLAAPLQGGRHRGRDRLRVRPGPGQVPGRQGRRRVRGLRGAGGGAGLTRATPTPMVGGLLRVELHVPAATSLKAKRGVVKALIAALRNALNVSVAEVDHQDLWQRCTLGIAIAAGSETGVRRIAQDVEKIVNREPRAEVIAFDLDIVVGEHT